MHAWGRNTDFQFQVDKLLLGEAGGSDPNPDETLTEAEFLISVLKDKGIVDDMTVQAIRLQFAHITRHDTKTKDNKVLDDKIVFLELRSQGRITSSAVRNSATLTSASHPAGAGQSIDLVDLSVADGGFQEWREKYWWPRVFDGKPMKHQVRLEAMPNKHKDANGNTRKDPRDPRSKGAQRPSYDFPFYELLEDGTQSVEQPMRNVGSPPAQQVQGGARGTPSRTPTGQPSNRTPQGSNRGRSPGGGKGTLHMCGRRN